MATKKNSKPTKTTRKAKATKRTAGPGGKMSQIAAAERVLAGSG